MVDKKHRSCYNVCIVKNKEIVMKYTLITKKGKVMQFYIKSMAELYHQMLGGALLVEPEPDLISQSPRSIYGHD